MVSVYLEEGLFKVLPFFQANIQVAVTKAEQAKFDADLKKKIAESKRKYVS